MNCKIEIRMDNAAFDGEDCGRELARILRAAAEKVDFAAAHDFPDSLALHDYNGNRVGRLEVSSD